MAHTAATASFAISVGPRRRGERDSNFCKFIYEQPSLLGAKHTFKHGLTLEVACNSMLAEGRPVIHDQTAPPYVRQLDRGDRRRQTSVCDP
jgi:hypothetical protein